MNIGTKIALTVLTSLTILSALRLNYTVYSNWNLYYTGSDVGSHLTQNYNPPAYKHYQFTITDGYGSCSTKVTFNGVTRTLTSVTTFDYNGTSNPNIQIRLVDYEPGFAASRSGSLKVAND